MSGILVNTGAQCREVQSGVVGDPSGLRAESQLPGGEGPADPHAGLLPGSRGRDSAANLKVRGHDG